MTGDRLPQGLPADDGPDERLMAAFAGGDLEAFGELVQRHRAVVVRFCRHMTGDWHAGEDAAQEAFVALYRCGPRYAPTAPLRALLFRLARNACADALRRRPATGHAPEGERADPSPPPETVAAARAEGARVRRALARLTPLQREVLVLSHFHGLTYAEVAQTLGVPLGTVCSRASAGFAALRRALQGEAGL